MLLCPPWPRHAEHISQLHRHRARHCWLAPRVIHNSRTADLPKPAPFPTCGSTGRASPTPHGAAQPPLTTNKPGTHGAGAAPGNPAPGSGPGPGSGSGSGSRPRPARARQTRGGAPGGVARRGGGVAWRGPAPRARCAAAVSVRRAANRDPGPSEGESPASPPRPIRGPHANRGGGRASGERAGRVGGGRLAGGGGSGGQWGGGAGGARPGGGAMQIWFEKRAGNPSFAGGPWRVTRLPSLHSLSAAAASWSHFPAGPTQRERPRSIRRICPPRRLRPPPAPRILQPGPPRHPRPPVFCAGPRHRGGKRLGRPGGEGRGEEATRLRGQSRREG